MSLLENISTKLNKLEFIKKLLLKGKVYLVGGIVRDSLLNIESNDIDLLVDGLSIDDIKNVLNKYGNVVEVGESFGVLKYKDENFETEFDIAVPRVEISTGGNYRDSKLALMLLLRKTFSGVTLQ